ncbi:MAG: D-arabinono-1,4-lactone oxidase [Actinophytocola sp.]|uniref:D-arabinono-1,4-lactone oxidase n=1 Tax=Actinophytocola sp. TaxID=1872138 RepID=UPI003D6C4CB2
MPRTAARRNWACRGAAGAVRVSTHWAKIFAMGPERVRSCYPRLPDFRELVRQYDPGGKFRNPFVDRYVSEPSFDAIPAS